MDDIRLKTVPFELDGKTYKLCCNMNVLADVQEDFGGSIGNAIAGGSVKSVLSFLSAMLNECCEIEGYPERFTRRELGRRYGMDIKALQRIGDIVMPLVIGSLPKRETPADGKDSEDGEKN